ncbi:DOMON domain-containing protein frrs1L [Bulinus truncatus]|nr:DOMON domain-containing protein frrs1L [Bulinus truncatus]
MCYLLVVLVLLSTVSFQVVKSHGDGTNVDAACQTLLPGHGPPSQNSLPPYKISFSPPRYIPGEPISITLLSCKDAFKGFMIQAHSAETSRNQDERFGNFTASENKLACNGSALVHSNNSPKTTVNIAWNPPEAPKGHIIFRVTYVKDIWTYWTNITSDVLYDASLNTSGVLYNKSDVDATCTGGVKPVTTTNVTKDSGCGSTKGCFSSCSADGCTFIASWASDNKTATYNLSSEILYQGNMYIALGFSSDSKMGDDSVMACAMNSSGSVFLILGFNTGHYKPETFNDSPDSELDSSNDEVWDLTDVSDVSDDENVSFNGSLNASNNHVFIG